MTPKNFEDVLKDMPYTRIGSYPTFLIMRDGSVMCYACACSQAGLIKEAIDDDWDDTLIPSEMCVNWENPELFCCSCSERIESAYCY